MDSNDKGKDDIGPCDGRTIDDRVCVRIASHDSQGKFSFLRSNDAEKDGAELRVSRRRSCAAQDHKLRLRPA